ncbi:MAG TPA: amidase [Streptosporangiaceae bacterium]
MTISESPGETIGGSGISPGEVSVAALREAMAAGTLTSAELVRFYLERIERQNPSLGAVISVSDDAAEQASAVDRARASGAELGPLAGIPVLIKDNISVAGSPATAGSPALLGGQARDAFLISRLRAANAVILGKANLSEWANFRSTQSSSGWSTLGGQAVNPHGTGRNPSGSSSGSAVAVAAGLAPLAVGTETDGSIVSPSHACGIVGVKPTIGLVSRGGIVPISAEQDTAGPMTRSVADAAALLGALAGADQADSATERAAGQPADYTQFLDPAALEGARIGVWREGSARAVAAASALLDSVVGLLRAHGAEIIDPVELADADKMGDPEFLALRHEFKDDLNAYLAALDGSGGSGGSGGSDVSHPRSLAELIAYNSAHADRVLVHFGQEIFEQAEATGGRSDDKWREARDDARRIATSGLDAALTEHRLDAVLALSGNPAWLTDYVLGDHYSIGTSSPAAVSGYPSITVPAGKVSGLPVGISLIGPAWSEPRLIAVAHAFELARG